MALGSLSVSPSKLHSAVPFAVNYSSDNFPWARIRTFCGRDWGFCFPGDLLLRASGNVYQLKFLFAPNKASSSWFKQKQSCWKAIRRLTGKVGDSNWEAVLVRTMVTDMPQKTAGGNVAVAVEHEMPQLSPWWGISPLEWPPGGFCTVPLLCIHHYYLHPSQGFRRMCLTDLCHVPVSKL